MFLTSVAMRRAATGQLEQAVGDDVARLRPVLAVLLNRGLVHRNERGVRQLLDEPRLRRRQGDPQLVSAEGRGMTDLAGEHHSSTRVLYASAPAIP